MEVVDDLTIEELEEMGFHTEDPEELLDGLELLEGLEEDKGDGDALLDVEETG